MRLDFDRVRELLMEMEASENGVFQFDRGFNDFDRYQLKRMAEAGLVSMSEHGRLDRESTGIPGLASYLTHTVEMTWKGHEYLDAVRDSGIWDQAKNAVAETGGSVTLEIAKALALGFLKKKISQHTGIDI